VHRAENKPKRVMNELKFSCFDSRQRVCRDAHSSGREIQYPNWKHLLRIPALPDKTAQYSSSLGKEFADVRLGRDRVVTRDCIAPTGSSTAGVFPSLSLSSHGLFWYGVKGPSRVR